MYEATARIIFYSTHILKNNEQHVTHNIKYIIYHIYI